MMRDNILLKFLLFFLIMDLSREENLESRLSLLEQTVESLTEENYKIKTDLKREVDSLKAEKRELKDGLEHLARTVSTLNDGIIELKKENDELKISMSRYDENTIHRRMGGERGSIVQASTDDTSENSISSMSSRDENHDRKLLNPVNKSATRTKRMSETENVAFHAYLSSSRCFNNHQIIEYDTEEIDIGNGYNPHDGIYVVPVSGVYAFTWTFALGYKEYAVTEIVVNGQKKGWTIADASGVVIFYSVSSNFIILSVNAGDHVLIRRVEGRGCNTIPTHYARTSFSGWRLF